MLTGPSGAGAETGAVFLSLFLSLAGSLALTLALELSFALAWRVDRRDLPAVALANLLTNPIVVLCYHGAAWYLPNILPAATLALELGAVAAEGLVYRRRSRISRPWTFSVCANAFSFFTGLLL